MTIRIYGKTLETWSAEDLKGRTRITQREIAYTEYDIEDGTITGIGSEDFSTERESSEVEMRWIWTWDGEKLNKGGHRWFECLGIIKFRKREKKSVKEYLNNKYKAEIIQLR